MHAAPSTKRTGRLFKTPVPRDGVLSSGRHDLPRRAALDSKPPSPTAVTWALLAHDHGNQRRVFPSCTRASRRLPRLGMHLGASSASSGARLPSSAVPCEQSAATLGTAVPTAVSLTFPFVRPFESRMHPWRMCAPTGRTVLEGATNRTPASAGRPEEHTRISCLAVCSRLHSCVLSACGSRVGLLVSFGSTRVFRRS